VVAGINAVIAALRADPAGVYQVQLAAGSSNQRLRDIEMLARDAGVEVLKVPRESVERLAGMERHQDAVALLHPKAPLHEDDLNRLLDDLEEPALLLVLDGVQDPHNLGACLRTAEAAGVHAVIVPKDRATGLTPVARKAAAGAADLVPLVIVTNLARVMRELKQRGIWLYGTSDQAGSGLWQEDLRGPVALVMGGEGDGLRRLTAELCDHLVAIPMAGKVESLNVSVATGVCLFEIRRQRQLA
jgi:23S rRNA (guanosine2251-2'-O)-methyltransferase